MKKIAILIDFSEGSVTALKQAVGFAHKTGADLYCVHVVSTPDKSKQAELELTDFIANNVDSSLTIESIISVGDLFTATQTALKRIHPDLVFVCTHGVKGMFQHLFGAHILKLVQDIKYPCIVVREKAELDISNLKNILLPIDSNPDFILKIKQTAALALALNLTIILYEIDRPGNEFQDIINQNSENAEQYFTTQNIPFTKVMEDTKVMSVGFSRQTINYALANQISLISLMASISKNEILFGAGDKESFLVNEQGVSILICNS